jgi:glutathione synthase/RimK-type ligase-like ATP-grasp enzyme
MTPDDQLAADALRLRGVDVEPAIWDAPDIDWAGFDLVVIRSTWDYQLRPAAYERWIRGFQSRPNRSWNPPDAILATVNKRYLIDLSARGARVVPTAYIEAGGGRSLRAIAADRRWGEVVVKPAISASARGTWRSTGGVTAEDEAAFAAQAVGQDVLVQPYCPEVSSRGEWSLVFFEGEYSHAVLKRPADGDFRVQRQFGGAPISAVPTARLIDQASAVLAQLGTPLLYARVDGVERGGDLLLMELEVNEPNLYLSFSPEAPARFADAIARRATN